MRVFNAVITWSTDQSTYTTSGDISNSTLYSVPISLRHIDVYSAQIVTTGATVTGAFKLQVSNDEPNLSPTNIPAASAMNWTDVDSSSQTVTTAGSVVWNASGAGYLWVRIVWTESGTAAGSVTGRQVAKGA